MPSVRARYVSQSFRRLSPARCGVGRSQARSLFSIRRASALSLLSLCWVPLTVVIQKPVYFRSQREEGRDIWVLAYAVQIPCSSARKPAFPGYKPMISPLRTHMTTSSLGERERLDQ